MNNNTVSKIQSNDISGVDYTKEIEGGTEHYFIRPMLLLEGPDKTPLTVYGIYNRETGVRETEVRDLASARAFAKGMTDNLTGGELPGLAAKEKKVK